MTGELGKISYNIEFYLDRYWYTVNKEVVEITVKNTIAQEESSSDVVNTPFFHNFWFREGQILVSTKDPTTVLETLEQGIHVGAPDSSQVESQPRFTCTGDVSRNQGGQHTSTSLVTRESHPGLSRSRRNRPSGISQDTRWHHKACIFQVMSASH